MNYFEIYKSHRLIRPQREKSPNTVSCYTAVLLALDKWLSQNHSISIQADSLLSLTPPILDSYDAHLFSLGYAHSTHNLHLTIIKAFFSWLTKAGYIQENPARMLEMVSPPEDEEKILQSARGFSVEEIAKIMSEATGCNRLRDRALIAIIAGSSMRVSEACSLNLENLTHLQQQGYTFVRIKGGRRVRMQVASWAMPHVLAYANTHRLGAAPADPLFVSTRGARLNRKTAWASVAQIEKRLGLKTGVHNLRHSAITEIKRSTGDISAAQLVAHHRSSRTTMGYDHTTVSLQPYLDNNALAQAFEKV